MAKANFNFPLRSQNAEEGWARARLTTANGADPTINRNPGGIIKTAARDGEGSIVVTLKDEVQYFDMAAFVNIRSSGDAKANVDAIADGNQVNTISITTTLATSADDVPGAILDLWITGSRRKL